ncbi:hypothetical protein JB92DRAFT_3038744 [Gautieria morchelliformis]|nr:hypothetical protein JB92DRAFT_3038744 [Gautieria morchelliformis]
MATRNFKPSLTIKGPPATTMMGQIPDRKTMESLSRTNIQKLCKENKIRANMKTQEMINALRDLVNVKEVPRPLRAERVGKGRPVLARGSGARHVTKVITRGAGRQTKATVMLQEEPIQEEGRRGRWIRRSFPRAHQQRESPPFISGANLGCPHIRDGDRHSPNRRASGRGKASPSGTSEIRGGCYPICEGSSGWPASSSETAGGGEWDFEGSCH